MDVTHGLGDFLTLPPGLSQFQAPYTLLSSFLCSCLCTYLGSPNKFSPVVKMNPPIGGFQNQHHPPCSVLHCWSRWRRSHSLHLQAPPRALQPCSQLRCPHPIPEVRSERFWYPPCDLCFSLPSSYVIMMRFIFTFVTLFSISFVLYHFFWIQSSCSCAYACWCKSSLCH